MKAAAAVCVEAGGRILRLHSAPPLTVRQTDPHEVHVVASAAGPLGGDELGLDVRVGAGGCLRLRGLGALLCLPRSHRCAGPPTDHGRGRRGAARLDAVFAADDPWPIGACCAAR